MKKNGWLTPSVFSINLNRKSKMNKYPLWNFPEGIDESVLTETLKSYHGKVNEGIVPSKKEVSVNDNFMEKYSITSDNQSTIDLMRFLSKQTKEELVQLNEGDLVLRNMKGKMKLVRPYSTPEDISNIDDRIAAIRRGEVRTIHHDGENKGKIFLGEELAFNHGFERYLDPKAYIAMFIMESNCNLFHDIVDATTYTKTWKDCGRGVSREMSNFSTTNYFRYLKEKQSVTSDEMEAYELAIKRKQIERSPFRSINYLYEESKLATKGGDDDSLKFELVDHAKDYWIPKNEPLYESVYTKERNLINRRKAKIFWMDYNYVGHQPNFNSDHYD